MTTILLTLLLLVSINGIAQHTDEQLYNAYLRNDMSVWEDYVTKAEWSVLSLEEKERLLNYEYGYVAVAIGEGHPKAENYLNIFEQHLKEVQPEIALATHSTYASAVAAYKISFNKFKMIYYGKQAISLAASAVEQDSLNPLAMTLKANVDFYCPKAFGGDKKRALKYLLRAEQLYQEQALTQYNWNYRALQLCIAQCYEKSGNKAKAIEKCQSILAEEPEFQYIANVYLPTLMGKRPNVAPTTAGNKLANSILQ